MPSWDESSAPLLSHQQQCLPRGSGVHFPELLLSGDSQSVVSLLKGMHGCTDMCKYVVHEIKQYVSFYFTNMENMQIKGEENNGLNPRCIFSSVFCSENFVWVLGLCSLSFHQDMEHLSLSAGCWPVCPFLIAKLNIILQLL